MKIEKTWRLTEDGCGAFLMRVGGNPENIGDRLAFIEKTPRIRIRSGLAIPQWEDWLNWVEGNKGDDCHDVDSRKWCETVLAFFHEFEEDPVAEARERFIALIRDIWGGYFNIDTVITDDMMLLQDLGGDSLDYVELILGVEDEFGIEISDEVAEKIVTVGDFMKVINDALYDPTIPRT